MRKLLAPALLGCLFSSTAAAQVLITEVQPNPTGSQNAEWVEIQNVGVSPVSIAGWRLHDYAGATATNYRVYAFPAGTTLAPGQVIVVTKQNSAFNPMAVAAGFAQTNADWELNDGTTDDPNVPNMTLVGGAQAFALGNTGDAVRLADASDVTVSGVEWGTVDRTEIPGTPAPVAGAGQSLGRVANNGSSSLDFIVLTAPTPGVGFNPNAPTPPAIAPHVRAPAAWVHGAPLSVTATVTDADGLAGVEVYFATATSSVGPAATAYAAIDALPAGNAQRVTGIASALAPSISFPAPTSFNERYLRYFIYALDDLGADATDPEDAATEAGNTAYFWENVLPAGTVWPIATARAQWASELPRWEHHSIRVEGVVLTQREAFATGTTNFFIASTSSLDAIRVFDSALNPVNVQPGDLVRVTGKIGIFRGVRQIGRDERAPNRVVGPQVTIELLGTAPVPVRTVTVGALLAAAEAYEGQLGEIEGATMPAAPGGGAPPATFPTNVTVHITDGTGTLPVRVFANTDLAGAATPAGTFTLRGILGQFTTSGTGGHQLQPRNAADLVLVGPPADGGTDGGVPPGDGGVDPMDSGMAGDTGVGIDAGAVEDSGVVQDAGVVQDSGGPAPDSGVPPVDAGVADTGAPPEDSGVARDSGPRPDSGTFGGERDEGCGCSATPVEAGHGSPALGLLLAGVLLVRRRRR